MRTSQVSSAHLAGEQRKSVKRKMAENVIVGGHRIHGQWRPIQTRTDGAAPVKNPHNGKAYWAGAAVGFGGTIYRNMDVIRPVAAGIAGGVAGFAAGGPAGAAQGAMMASAAAI